MPCWLIASTPPWIECPYSLLWPRGGLEWFQHPDFLDGARCRDPIAFHVHVCTTPLAEPSPWWLVRLPGPDLLAQWASEPISEADVACQQIELVPNDPL